MLRFRIDRDEAIIAKIEESCERFWDCVQTGTPPEPVNLSDVDARWKTHSPGRIVEADEDLVALVEKRAALKAQKKDLETDLDFTNFQLKRAMEDAEELRRKGKKLLTWKSHTREFLDTTRLKESYPDIVAPFTEERIVRVLR